MNTSKKETLAIAPQAFCKKVEMGYGVFKDKLSKKPCVVTKSAGEAWDEAAHILNHNMVKIPFSGNCIAMVRVGDKYYADEKHCKGYYFRWMDKSKYLPVEKTAYNVTFRVSTTGTGYNKWYWSAYADEESQKRGDPLFYNLGSFVYFVTKEEAVEDFKTMSDILPRLKFVGFFKSKSHKH